MRVPILKSLAVAAAILAGPSAARADWLTEYSGNSVVKSPDQLADGVINFAVYKSTSGDWQKDLGVTATGIKNVDTGKVSAVDTDATYIYMYQVVNTMVVADKDNPVLVALEVAVEPNNVTGFGKLSGTVFKDAGGLVGGIGNTRLDTGTDPGPGSPENIPLDGKASFSFPANSTGAVDVGSDTAAIGPTSAYFTTDPDSPTNYGPWLRFNFELAANEYSTIVYFTSTVPPIYGGGALLQGTKYALGDVATVTRAPEPGTMALLALGLPLAGYGYRRRLQKRAAAEAAAV